MKSILSTDFGKTGRYNRIALLIAIILTAVMQSLADSKVPEQDLLALDDAISRSEVYTGHKIKSIDSLRNKLARTPSSDFERKLRLTLKISDMYRPVNADSAMVYATDAIELLRTQSGDNIAETSDEYVKCRIAMLQALSTAGIFNSAQMVYDELASLPLTPSQKLEFWRAARMMYSYMKAYVSGGGNLYNEYDKMNIAYDDSLLSALPHGDPFYRFIYCERLVRDDKYQEAKRLLIPMMSELRDDNNLYGMTAYQLAEVYYREGDNGLYASYLCKAAISDIKCCVREGLALPTLAQWLYSNGHLNDAFRYINFALSEANAGNARMRAVAIAELMPVIDSAYREKISSTNSKLTFTIILVSIFSCLSVVLVVILIRFIRRNRRIHDKLQATSKVQESYIGHFVALCASYAGKLDQLTHLVNRKLASGQSEELLKLVKSGRFADAQNDEFYRIFDNAFLDIYPDFIEEINALLADGKTFENIEKGTLPPELRIYALVRLGISESTRISQVLHYSVSTVYTYRNRMRNRAAERENFEKSVLEIGRNSAYIF